MFSSDVENGISRTMYVCVYSVCVTYVVRFAISKLSVTTTMGVRESVEGLLG